MAPSRKKSPKFLCVMVTGISGAGKSQAIKCLEDFGFFCVDNLPAPLLPSFADLIVRSGKPMRRVALGVDVREGLFLNRLSQSLQQFRQRGIQTWILYLDADNETLLKRFSETRRKHPLGKGVLEGIRDERRFMRGIRAQADRILGTSHLTLSELKELVASSLPTTVNRSLQISVCSFGYKHGLPADADMVWDVRFMPNPHYVPSLQKKTGLTAPVRRYVMKQKNTRRFLGQFCDLVKLCLPQYGREGKSYLTVAIGCTGGHHRSVAVAEFLARELKAAGYPVSIRHRDIAK